MQSFASDLNRIEYVYDPLMRRAAKKVNGTIVEKYLWQGLTRLLAVYDGNDNLLMRFEYADARMPVAMTKDGATYYLAYDQVGSLRAVADSSGMVVKRIDYDSFGNIIDDTAPSFLIPFAFAGGLYDLDTGLIRFGYRDYDPDIGRWTAKDPIFFAGRATDLYGYCLNDSVNLVDSDGLIPAFLGPILAGAAQGFITGAIAGAATGGLIAAFEGGSVRAGVLGGSIAGGISGAFGGAISGAFGGGVLGGIAGTLFGTPIGEMLGPSTVARDSEQPKDFVRRPIPKPWEFRAPVPENPLKQSSEPDTPCHR